MAQMIGRSTSNSANNLKFACTDCLSIFEKKSGTKDIRVNRTYPLRGKNGLTLLVNPSKPVRESAKGKGKAEGLIFFERDKGLSNGKGLEKVKRKKLRANEL